MFLWELFDDSNDTGGDLVNRLRQGLIDILTPMAATGVPFVTVGSVIGQLRKMRSGIDVDRGLVMQVLDPQAVKMVTKIEGDRIYFSLPDDNENEANDQQKQKDADHVASTAAKQAQKTVSQ